MLILQVQHYIKPSSFTLLYLYRLQINVHDGMVLRSLAICALSHADVSIAPPMHAHCAR